MVFIKKQDKIVQKQKYIDSITIINSAEIEHLKKENDCTIINTDKTIAPIEIECLCLSCENKNVPMTITKNNGQKVQYGYLHHCKLIDTTLIPLIDNHGIKVYDVKHCTGFKESEI